MVFRQTRNQVSFRPASKKRQTEWSLCSISTGYSTIAASSKVLMVVFPAAMLSPESPATIVRTRGVLSIRPVETAIDRTLVGAVGFGIVNTVAGALGITALPGPSAQCSWAGWFVWQTFIEQFFITTDVGWDFASKSFTIDSKAMRKFKEDEALVVVIENAGT